MSELEDQLYGALARLEKRHVQDPERSRIAPQMNLQKCTSPSEKGDPLITVMQLEELSKKTGLNHRDPSKDRDPPDQDHGDGD